MHVHIGFAEAVQWTALMVIIGFIWRSLAAKLADTPIGKAMAYIY
jgi:hypothetical protein